MANCYNDCIHSFVCQYVNHDEYPSVQQLKDDCRYCTIGTDVVPKSEVDDLKRYIILNEDIAIKCKQENGEQNEEYWKGKISAFRQIRAYVDAELKKKYKEV